MVLIFLILMMLIDAVAIRNVTLDEKMTANSRDQQLAFQAVEKGLRHCEIVAQKTRSRRSQAIRRSRSPT